MKSTYTKLFLFLGCTALIAGCRKEPGEGGSAIIKGTLYSQNVHNYTTPVTAEDYEDNQKVYIAYGDKDTYDNDYNTSYDGSFQFKYLRKGTYKLFAYSTDPTTLQTTFKTKLIEIKSTNEVVDVKDFVVFKDASSGGKATIKGKLLTKNYDKNGVYLGDDSGAEEDVYISYGGNAVYDDKTKSSYDGTFSFKGLRKGKYKVFTYSQDPNKLGKQMVAIDTTITDKFQTIELSQMTIKK